ncbi:MAG: hypothetical protein OIF56_14730 [Cohaesibacter sp.]|nr:hypothetical protein [Cohaesibacter sp.]MCV6601184.1 hypothetical protein [Cohaesibacter sp.]
MTAIGSVTSNTTSSSAADKTALIGNYETFLTLLTTQLKNQSPLDPMDANKFTQQLVQFSSVEQQIKANKQMESLVAMTTATNALNSLKFVGQNVTLDGTHGTLSAGQSLKWKFTAPKDGTMDVIIRNHAGNIVRTEKGVDIKSGEQTYTWNGKTNDGSFLPSGSYKIEFKAKDKNKVAQNISTETKGMVSDVDLSTSEPMLIIGKQKYRMNQVKAVGFSSSSSNNGGSSN